MQAALFVFTILTICIIATVNGLGFTVSTLNIWNQMFNWDVRKIRIREMIHDVNSDIVGLQEVRSSYNYTRANQLLELQAGLTSQFQWSNYMVANNVSYVEKSIHKEFPGEGLGLLSKIEVIKTQIHYLLPSERDPDKNKRLFMHVIVKEPVKNNLFSIIVVHLSYFRQQQCRNVEELINYINRRKLFNIIILGDFNTYSDFEGPVQMLVDGKIEEDNPCREAVMDPSIEVSLRTLTDRLTFVDAWKSMEPSKDGYTFSNMPSPGLESRPDRILVASNLWVQSVRLNGDGTRYRQRYTASIHWERFCTVVYSSYLSHQGVTGYSCKHDCGPHGSCQCGVCIATGNKDTCLLPDCEKCNQDVFKMLVLHFVVCSIVLFHLSYAIVVIFVVAGGSYGETLYSYLGCNCCLMNPKLFFTSTRLHARKYKILQVCKCWPVFRLPPYVQLLVSVAGLIIMYVWTRSALAPQLELAYSELPEELFPSDHRMLTAEIKLPSFTEAMDKIKCWLVFRLPPYVQLLVSVAGLIIVYVWTRSALAPQLELAYSELAEELFPSDHRMLTAEIKLPSFTEAGEAMDKIRAIYGPFD